MIPDLDQCNTQLTLYCPKVNHISYFHEKLSTTFSVISVDRQTDKQTSKPRQKSGRHIEIITRWITKSSGSVTAPGHYGDHPCPQVADRGTPSRMVKRVAPDKEGAADNQCLGEGKL